MSILSELQTLMASEEFKQQIIFGAVSKAQAKTGLEIDINKNETLQALTVGLVTGQYLAEAGYELTDENIVSMGEAVKKNFPKGE